MAATLIGGDRLENRKDWKEKRENKSGKQEIGKGREEEKGDE